MHSRSYRQTARNPERTATASTAERQAAGGKSVVDGAEPRLVMVTMRSPGEPDPLGDGVGPPAETTVKGCSESAM